MGAINKQMLWHSGQPRIENMKFDNLITIAADSIEKLRMCDVFRVLEWNEENRAELAEWLKTKRPDLAEEVESSLRDL